jgi:hypothetical protein
MKAMCNDLIYNLPVLPRRMLVKENSSHNRGGVNNDSGNFQYVDENGESVLFDAYGPGCVCSIFTTNIINDTAIKLYFDGAEEPAYSMPIREFFSGKHPDFPSPMVSCEVLGFNIGEDSLAGNCLLPIPFDKSLKITVVGDTDIFYHILWEQYPHGEGPDAKGIERRVSASRALWNHPYEWKCDGDTREVCLEIAPGEKAAAYECEGSACIRSFAVEGGCVESLLRDVFVCMRWDGNTYDSVRAPLGHFFAVPEGPVQMDTPLVTVERPDEFTVRLVSRWPMPFWEKASITLVNAGKFIIKANVRTEVAEQAYSREECGYFTAHYRCGETEYGKDWTLARFDGWGKYAGTVQTMLGGHYCEGDEHFYIDGACAPQINGTGTEDYYLFCFWPNPLRFTPYNGSTADVHRKGGGVCENSYLYPTAYYRFHLDGPIAFYSGIDARIQHGGMSNIRSQYTSLSFLYLKKTPALALSDCIRPGSEASRQAHGYGAGGMKASVVESSFIGNNIDVRQRLTGLEMPGGEIRFEIALDPGNDGVLLRRRIDQKHARQKAAVYVDGEYAGVWYDANLNDTHRWHDSDFLVPQALCAGKDRLGVLLRIEPCGGCRFTDYGIEAYSFARAMAQAYSDQGESRGCRQDK